MLIQIRHLVRIIMFFFFTQQKDSIAKLKHKTRDWCFHSIDSQEHKRWEVLQWPSSFFCEQCQAQPWHICLFIGSVQCVVHMVELEAIEKRKSHSLKKRWTLLCKEKTSITQTLQTLYSKVFALQGKILAQPWAGPCYQVAEEKHRERLLFASWWCGHDQASPVSTL